MTRTKRQLFILSDDLSPAPAPVSLDEQETGPNAVESINRDGSVVLPRPLRGRASNGSLRHTCEIHCLLLPEAPDRHYFFLTPAHQVQRFLFEAVGSRRLGPGRSFCSCRVQMRCRQTYLPDFLAHPFLIK